MRALPIIATVAISLVCTAAASAAPQIKATLACKLGQAMEQDHMLDIQNTTKAPLPPETIVNLYITAAPHGEQYDCFALTSPLAAGAHISHMEKVNVGNTGMACKAFLSSKYPAISHGSGGSSSTQCDY
jgi:hypothetical protein